MQYFEGSLRCVDGLLRQLPVTLLDHNGNLGDEVEHHEYLEDDREEPSKARRKGSRSLIRNGDKLTELVVPSQIVTDRS